MRAAAFVFLRPHRAFSRARCVTVPVIAVTALVALIRSARPESAWYRFENCATVAGRWL
jgi:hypothetical protein